MADPMEELKADQSEELPLAPTTEDCKDRTFVVTGANTGLGFEAANHLVALGAAKVILGVRSAEKGNEAKDKIETTTGIKGVAEVWILDMSSYKSVQEFGKRLLALDRLDVVIENAGVAMSEKVMAEGLESTLTINVVSTMLLAAIVAPKLQETGKKFGGSPHIVIVSSGVAFQPVGLLEKIGGDILDTLSANDTKDMMSYPISKLLEVYAVRQYALLHPVAETGVTINTVNPGLCVTGLSRNAPPPMRDHIVKMQQAMGRTAEAGSRTLLYGAVAGKDSHGKYTSECRIRENDRVPDWIGNESGQNVQQRVWESLSKKLEAIQPRCI